jgi:hypothetical protein
MLATFGVSAVSIVIFLSQGIPLYKQKKKKELVIFSALLLAALTLSIIVALHLNVPTPTDILEKLLGPLAKPIVLWLKEHTYD